MNDDLHSIAKEADDVVRIERLTHHIARIREGMDEMRRGQDDLRASMKQMADALTLVEERQSTTSTAIERMNVVIHNIDDRVRMIEQV